MRSMTAWVAVAFLVMALAGCTDEAGGSANAPADYVAGDHRVPDGFEMASTDDNATADFFRSAQMTSNPGDMPAEQFGGNQTGAEEAYGALLVASSNNSSLIFWGAVGFSNETSAQDFTDTMQSNQACRSFAGVLRDQMNVVLVQSTPDNATAAAAATIVDDLEASMQMERVC